MAGIIYVGAGLFSFFDNLSTGISGIFSGFFSSPIILYPSLVVSLFIWGLLFYKPIINFFNSGTKMNDGLSSDSSLSDSSLSNSSLS
jgi:hypothetical protein